MNKIFFAVGGLALLSGINHANALAATVAPNIVKQDSQSVQSALNAVWDEIKGLQDIKITAGDPSIGINNAGGILDKFKGRWLQLNGWLESKIGFSLRSIMRLAAYTLIYVALLWVKLLQWFLNAV